VRCQDHRARGVSTVMRRAAPLAAAVLLLTSASAAAASSTLTLGFVEPSLEDPATSAEWLPRAAQAGGQAVRLTADWSVVAHRRPANAADPADPAYDWDKLDAAVRATTAAGMEPTILAYRAPAWAEGDGREKDAATGSWRPDVDAFGAFARAIATRYSGAYADLPRVGRYQAWNEPNLDQYLTPQWTAHGDSFRTSSPDLYRSLLNAFYAGVKAADPAALVVTAGTGPFGDYRAGGRRLPPARFWREVLCLDRKLRKTCSTTTRFDVVDHHPYSIGAPARQALNVDDASIPDLAKITRPVTAAVRLGTALPATRKRLWITEVSWDSSPPDPDGVPEGKRARWIAEMLYRVWAQGADTVTWFLLRDQRPVPAFDATYQSGLFTHDGDAKLGMQAFRFPLVPLARRGGRARIWLRVPVAGTVTVERRSGDRWSPVVTFSATGGGVSVRRLALPRGTTVRATSGGITSLARKVP
jgi:hypothetical protein